MPSATITVQNKATGTRWQVFGADANLSRAVTDAIKNRISLADVDKVMSWVTDGFQGKRQYGANEVEIMRTVIRAAMRDARHRSDGRLVIRPNTVIRINDRRIEFTGPKAAEKFLHEAFSFFGSLDSGKVERVLSKVPAGTSKTKAKKEAKEIAQAAEQFTNADAARKLVGLLKEAEAVNPRYDYSMRGSVDAITLGTVQRTAKSNKLSKKVRSAAEQAFRTTFARKIAVELQQRRQNMIDHNERWGHDHALPEFPRGEAFERQLKWGWVRTSDADWRKMERDLVRMVSSSRPGKTAKAIIAAKSDLAKVDLDKIDGEKDRAQVFQQVMMVVFNRHGVARNGRVTWDNIDAYFNTANGKRHTPTFKRLVRSSFFYLAKEMRDGRAGRNASLCYDEGRTAMQKLLELQPTTRRGSIYALAKSAAKNGIYRRS